MPPEMAVSMRHTKLKAEEVALIAGEVTKPSWESRNEGIHERVSFEDTIWGFDLAGGAYYDTPLRVTYVKPDSRAEKAGIRPGDRLLRINGIDTSTLTIQEAHDIIIKAGLHLQLNVTAPEDITDAYYCYEDPIIDEYEAEQERLRAEEAARRRQVHARVSSFWSLQWPWVSKRRIIWRESNCYLVPSKYEEKHRDKFPVQPMIRREDDLVLDSVKKPSRRDTPPKFVRSRSYVGITNNENTTESLNGKLNDDKPNSNGKENGNYEESMPNGNVNEVDGRNSKNKSVIENNENDSLYTEDDDNNDMKIKEKGISDDDSEVIIEEIDENNENIKQDTVEYNKEELQNNDDEESNDGQGKGDLSDINNNEKKIEVESTEVVESLKSEEDDIIETVLNGYGHDIDNSEPMNER